MSTSVTFDQPRVRSASATPRPLVSETSRSDDQPPISTTTCKSLFIPLPTRWISHSRVMLDFCQHPAADFLAQRLDVGAGRATEVEQEVAMLFRDLRAAERQAAAARRVDQRPGLVRRAGS